MKKTVNNITIEEKKCGYFILWQGDSNDCFYIPKDSLSDLEACIHQIKENKPTCGHSWLADKKKNFAYCEKCLMCIKDGKVMTKEEYLKKPKKIKKAVHFRTPSGVVTTEEGYKKDIDRIYKKFKSKK